MKLQCHDCAATVSVLPDFHDGREEYYSHSSVLIYAPGWAVLFMSGLAWCPEHARP